MRVRLAGLAMAGLVGCAERAAIAPEPKIERVTLLPSLHTGEMLVYRVDAMIEGARGAEHASATLQFDDKVEVVSPAEIRETFANVAATGNGQLGDSLQRIATILPSARVTTRFDASWQIASSSIDGTDDDEARTLIMNLTPIVSFKMLPRRPVDVGDSWTSQWSEPLRSERGRATGAVASTVRYQLHAIAACGSRRCATIVGDGEDLIPASDGITGTSTFHGEQQVDLLDSWPVEKTIESKTTMQDQRVQPVIYTNVARVHARRAGQRS